MLHYTLNTNDTRVSPRSEISDEAIAMVKPLLEVGEHELPVFPEFSIKVASIDTGLFATVFHTATQRPCISIAVADDGETADYIWPFIEKHYLQLGDLPGIRSADFSAPQRPVETPWCAAITILATPDEAFWMADFERCLAWGWLESRKAGA